MADYKLDALAHAANVTPRTVRYYAERGLLPAATFRGMSTTYGDEHLLRLRAIRRLRREERLGVEAIRRRLAKMSPAALKAFADPPAPAEAKAAAPALPLAGADRWERVVLLPGLELHLRSDAGPLLRRLAGEICAQYAAAAQEPVAPGGDAAGAAGKAG